MDTLTSLRVFRLAVELKSFAGAARRLNMSPAMASKHLAHLEARLGTRLLNRSSRRLSLTEAGTAYLGQVSQLLDSLDTLEATVGGDTLTPRGLLRLSAPVWFANEHFVAVLADFRRQCPDVRLDIDLSGRMVNLVEEGFDLALRVAPSRQITQANARRLSPVAFFPVGSPAYLARRGEPARPQDLAQHDVIYYALAPLGDRIEFGDGEIVAMTPVLKSNNETLIRTAALNGLGLAFLPQWLIEEDLALGRLRCVLPEAPLPEIALHAVFSSRQYLPLKTRAFVDFLAADPRMQLG